MDYVIKKTYLGLALSEVLEENCLEHMEKEIGEVFKAAFIKNYNHLVKHSEPITIVGVEENLKESPIGSGDQYSCYTVIARQINYRGQIEFLNNKTEATTCIEAFSDNKKKITKSGKALTKRSLKNPHPSKLEKKFKKFKGCDDF
jgi:hypothetical protein